MSGRLLADSTCVDGWTCRWRTNRWMDGYVFFSRNEDVPRIRSYDQGAGAAAAPAVAAKCDIFFFLFS